MGCRQNGSGAQGRGQCVKNPFPSAAESTCDAVERLEPVSFAAAGAGPRLSAGPRLDAGSGKGLSMTCLESQNGNSGLYGMLAAQLGEVAVQPRFVKLVNRLAGMMLLVAALALAKSRL